LTHTFESAQIGNFERTLWVGGEPRMYSFSVAPVGKAPVEQVTVVGIDRTEAARMSEELFQAQKQQAVGTLVGGIAHDFNNLLTVVSGNIALLAADSNLSGEDREMALEVKEAAEKAAGLTRQLLLFTRRKPQRVESLQLRDVVESLLPILTRLLGERIRLEVEVEQGLPRVLLDATQCEQILMNLVVNARDAIRDAGTVSLKIQRKAEGVELRVSDTGAGIEEGVLHHIFDPFFTTKPIGQGTGLGLATVRSITEQAGGTVEVESKPGFGTDFILTFPISQEKFSAPEESSDVRGLGRKVLFVDDDEKVLRLGVKMLEAQGYHARGCTTFSEALKVAEESELDALVTDVRLPDASGRDIAAAMRARLPGLVVVFVSGYIDDPELLDQADRGEEVVVDKPFSSRSLGEALRLAFRRSRRGSLPIRQQKPEGS
jgi:signal transduction histidine kinase/CheY-like chemotaxis protein